MPKRKEKPKRMTQAEQHARFVEAAKNAEADESPEALNRAFVRLNTKKSTDSKGKVPKR